jgi:hypothetical protein
MSIKNLYSTVQPSLLLDFATTKRLDPRVSFSRASTGRFYDGKTVAKAEENLFERSQEFDNAYWSKGANVTLTANGATAPDGTATAEIISTSDASDLSGRRVSRVVTSPVGTYTFSVFMRAASSQTVRLKVGENSGATLVSNTDVSVTSTWTRFTVTFTITLANLSVGIGPNDVTALSNVEIWGAQLEQRSAVTAYSATTTQPITNYIPALQTAAAGQARFEHNPTTGESLGLLVEEQRTNLCLQSETFDNASWTKSASSVTANTIVAPDGSLTGDNLIEDTTNAVHFAHQSLAFTSGTTYTFSVYVKSAGRTKMTLGFQTTLLTSNFASFDLSAGTITGQGSNATPRITAVGNGWYRVSNTVTPTASVTAQAQIVLRDAADDSTYTGDGYSGIFIWGAQLEAGAFATSYIPTTSASATRSADAASMTGANFSSWYSTAEGAWYAEAAIPSVTDYSRIFTTSDGTTSNRIQLVLDKSTNNFTTTITTNGTAQAAINSPVTVAGNTYYKAAVAFKTDDCASTNSGLSPVADTSAVMPAVDRIVLGGLTSGVDKGVLIKKLAFYPKRLTNAQLQALTQS